MPESDYKTLSYTPTSNKNKFTDQVDAYSQQVTTQYNLAKTISQNTVSPSDINAFYTSSNTTIANLEKQKSIAYGQLNYWSAVVPQTTDTQKQVTKYGALITSLTSQITAAQKTFSDGVAALNAKSAAAAAAQKQLLLTKKTGQKPINGSTGTGADPGSNDTKDPLSHKYNASMVSSAYTTKGIQADVAGRRDLITNPGNFTSAWNAWKDQKGAKGTIQMSKQFADVATNSQNTTNSGVQSIKDSQAYGFKFLYNPTSINMAWGIVENFSPQFEASGQDRASAISAGLMKSAITFSVMLNRMGDMGYLNSNGFADQSYVNNYPTPPSNEDAKTIYKRGTMYDLEYLFRTVGGYNSQYNSHLNGITADKGWLMPIPVELHLGDGLRYLVRVSQLDLQHIIFNERMVPILTQVNFTCTRYFDGPEMYSSSDQKTALSTLDVFNTGGAPVTPTTPH